VREFVDKNGQARKSVALRLLSNANFRILKYPQTGEYQNNGGGKGSSGVFEGKDNGQVYD
jgi:hypothetical protein